MNSLTLKHPFPIRPLSSVSSRTGNSKGYKPCANIQSHVKDKETIPKNEAITTKFSIKMKSDNPIQEYLDTLVSSTKVRYWK